MTPEERKVWLDNLKPGDEIACIEHAWGDKFRTIVRTIVKITPQQIRFAPDSQCPRYIRRNGVQDGGYGYSRFYIPNTPEAIQARIDDIRRDNRIREINKRVGQDITDDQLERIEAILDEGEGAG